MADFTFGGTDEENAELRKLNAEVVSRKHFTEMTTPCIDVPSLERRAG